MVDAPQDLSGEGLGEGLIWDSIKCQLYKAEATLVKQLVGGKLIQQNRLMWNEAQSLREMLSDFRQRNEESERKQNVDWCDSQYRAVLRRQTQLVVAELRLQAEASGLAAEEILPELTDQQLCDFLFASSSPYEDTGSGVQTPSTRPSSSCGNSLSCSTPDFISNLCSIPSLSKAKGRQLDIEEVHEIGAAVKEALEMERQALLATISTDMQCLEAEDSRRVHLERRASCKEPSTEQLQQFLHKVQELSASPQLKTSTPTVLARPPRSPLSGGANVRRLQALVASRRQASAQHCFMATPEESNLEDHSSMILEAPPVETNKEYDPFFDDPFVFWSMPETNQREGSAELCLSQARAQPKADEAQDNARAKEESTKSLSQSRESSQSQAEIQVKPELSQSQTIAGSAPELGQNQVKAKAKAKLTPQPPRQCQVKARPKATAPAAKKKVARTWSSSW